ncbi:2TM domain-containing protein [Yersinia intermedia]|uniref:2TM domain-containing protein n=1 Tax=Yersinia intermedia TaxID=631 RepID=UPI000682F15A
MRSDNEYRNAIRRVKKKIAFHFHLIIYVVVNIFLFAINMLGGNEIWFYYPLLGWLIGLLIHAFFTYSDIPSSLRKKMIERELKSIKRTNNKR